MKIGFDLRTIAKGRRTGIEEYTLNILQELLKSKEDEFLLFYNAFLKSQVPKFILKRKNAKLFDFNVPDKLVGFFSFFSQPKVDDILGGTDVFFSPHFMSSYVKKSKKVVVFHDLSFLYYPEFFSFKKRYWHFLQNPKKQAKNADMIITVSESTKFDIVEFYKIEEKKIKVIYPGVNRNFKPLFKNEILESVRKKYDLPERFILYFGTIEPRKNIEGIISAFEKVREKEKISLVLAGTFGWLFDDILNKAKNSKFKNDIVFTGFVNQNDKVHIYNMAELFLYPSFFEGFGMPPLEAMACGVPAIVSNCSSMPEVVGDSAVLVNPYNENEIAQAILAILKDEKLKKTFKEKGILRSKKFSWEKAGKETLKVLKSV